jgi:hypothetical protein
MAAVVINPPRSRALPKPDLLGVAADGYRTKPIRELRWAEAHAAIKVPLNFHVDKSAGAVLEGCSANPDKF